MNTEEQEELQKALGEASLISLVVFLDDCMTHYQGVMSAFPKASVEGASTIETAIYALNEIETKVALIKGNLLGLKEEHESYFAN